MKCLIVLVCALTLGDAGTLRCSGHDDANCQLTEDINYERPIAQATENADTKETDATEAECLPGTEWESNCHFCRCAEGGVAQCIRQAECGSIFGEPLKCKPNTTFTRDCNTCICLENGLGLCTLESCQRSSIAKKSELQSGKECAPGSKWASSCNQCWCSPSGFRICTLRICTSDEEARELFCAPDTMWNNNCNTCWCTAEGRAMCTKMGCVTDAQINESSQVENSAVKASLEPDMTLPKASKNKTQKKVCIANRMFIMDCNTCWCNEDGTSFFCTRRVCAPDFPEDSSEKTPQDLRIVKKECRPDEVFELDCSMCRCSSDGKSFSCTRRLCLEQTDYEKNTSLSRKTRGVAQEPPKTCQPGKEFRMDCNKCLCDDEGQDFSCTRIDCNAQNNNNGGARVKRENSEVVPMECVPGSVFDKDCNVCHCTIDGLHATCTLKRCSVPNNQNNDVNVPVPEQDSNFRCNPGEQFKRGCNDCSCSADGKSIFCTVRFCDQDITPPPSI